MQEITEITDNKGLSQLPRQVLIERKWEWQEQNLIVHESSLRANNIFRINRCRPEWKRFEVSHTTRRIQAKRLPDKKIKLDWESRIIVLFHRRAPDIQAGTGSCGHVSIDRVKMIGDK